MKDYETYCRINNLTWEGILKEKVIIIKDILDYFELDIYTEEECFYKLMDISKSSLYILYNEIKEINTEERLNYLKKYLHTIIYYIKLNGEIFYSDKLPLSFKTYINKNIFINEKKLNIIDGLLDSFIDEEDINGYLKLYMKIKNKYLSDFKFRNLIFENNYDYSIYPTEIILYNDDDITNTTKKINSFFETNVKMEINNIKRDDYNKIKSYCETNNETVLIFENYIFTTKDKNNHYKINIVIMVNNYEYIIEPIIIIKPEIEKQTTVKELIEFYKEIKEKNIFINKTKAFELYKNVLRIVNKFKEILEIEINEEEQIDINKLLI